MKLIIEVNGDTPEELADRVRKAADNIAMFVGHGFPWEQGDGESVGPQLSHRWGWRWEIAEQGGPTRAEAEAARAEFRAKHDIAAVKE